MIFNSISRSIAKQLITYSQIDLHIGFSSMREILKPEDLKPLIQAGKPLLVDFTASWCGPCKMFAPVLDKVAKSNPAVDFVKVDIDKVPELAEQFKVMSVPKVSLFQSGKEVNGFVGVRDEGFMQKFIKENFD